MRSELTSVFKQRLLVLDKHSVAASKVAQLGSTNSASIARGIIAESKYYVHSYILYSFLVSIFHQKFSPYWGGAQMKNSTFNRKSATINSD